MKCPKCEAPMKKLQQVCDDCGWQRGVGVDRPRKMCSFHADGKSCPASWSYEIEGKPWCYWHSPHNSFETNRMILNDLLQNGLPKVLDWRDYFIEQTSRGIPLDDIRKAWKALQHFASKAA